MIPYTVPSKIYQVIPELDAIVQHDRGGALILDRFFPVVWKQSSRITKKQFSPDVRSPSKINGKTGIPSPVSCFLSWYKKQQKNQGCRKTGWISSPSAKKEKLIPLGRDSDSFFFFTLIPFRFCSPVFLRPEDSVPFMGGVPSSASSLITSFPFPVLLAEVPIYRNAGRLPTPVSIQRSPFELS